MVNVYLCIPYSEIRVWWISEDGGLKSSHVFIFSDDCGFLQICTIVTGSTEQIYWFDGSCQEYNLKLTNSLVFSDNRLCKSNNSPDGLG